MTKLEPVKASLACFACANRKTSLCEYRKCVACMVEGKPGTGCVGPEHCRQSQTTERMFVRGCAAFKQLDWDL